MKAKVRRGHQGYLVQNIDPPVPQEIAPCEMEAASEQPLLRAWIGDRPILADDPPFHLLVALLQSPSRKRVQHVKYLEHTLLALRMNRTREIKSVVIHG
jgi:hypothetical protein